ncbi:MFS transporter [Deinococcus metallilatus]|uniref:MFS family permease n=1 Tax=Deinococcus metallilatus TaxID=1211322 RepID=A0AAJ5F2V8_9DEIO|nr:MFS transporter [Deinococcus metallilatus]MBB5296724.1 MFS family permease [Deinococcus metallilatus]QBY09199.1 MFS transporter [Deinococcus metallilatus]RXJ09716.1 MFS transporter [Deinococcus metallilatus]TLK24182.1 MFS transporter [Deinococcus metallilatus]
MLARASAWRMQTFRALRHPSYRRYWFSQLLSLVGSWMQTTAQQYLVLELSGGSSAALGYVTVTQFLPSLLLSLFAGAVVDRVPRRRVLLATQTTLMLTAAALAVTTHLGVVSLPLVMVLAFISGTANAFDMPARQSMVVDFVPRGDVPNAVALNSLSFNVSRTIGQALFGVVAALGVALLAGGNENNIARLALPFYLNVVSFFVVLFVIATLPFPLREHAARGSMLDDIREGLRYVRGNPAVRNVMLLVGALSLTVINFNIIIPYYARVVFGAREATFGVLSAAFGVGAMAGALWQASKPNPVRNLRIGALLLLASTALLAFTPGPVLGTPVLAACGFGMLSLLVSANSTVQLSIPDQLRGRVMSLYSFVLVGMGPPGALIASNLISKQGPLGPRWGLVALTLLGALSLLLLWTRLPRRLTPPAAQSVPAD